MAVSLMCWALWLCDVCMAVSLMRWALWSYGRQSDALGFVIVHGRQALLSYGCQATSASSINTLSHDTI